MAATAMFRAARAGLFVGLSLSLASVPAGALTTPKESSSYLEQKAFFKPELYISSSQAPLAEIVDRLPNRAAWEAFAARPAADGSPHARVHRSALGRGRQPDGRRPAHPRPRRRQPRDARRRSAPRLGRTCEAVDEAVVADATRALRRPDRDRARHRRRPARAPPRPRRSTPTSGRSASRRPTRASPCATAASRPRISHGNLVVDRHRDLGQRARPRRRARASPPTQALDAGFAYADGRAAEDEILRAAARSRSSRARRRSTRAARRFAGPGRAAATATAWSGPSSSSARPSDARWEVMVDAHTARCSPSRTSNHYVERQVTGGVYPLTSTEICPDADQLRHHADRLAHAVREHRPRRAQQLHQQRRHLQLHERHRHHHADRPLRATSSTPAARSATARPPATSTWAAPTASTTAPPAAASPATPPASRSALLRGQQARRAGARLAARQHLAAAASSPPTSTSTRPATPSGTAPPINFYRSGGGCRNTGEIAAVFDHEWGHGLDDNDADGALSATPARATPTSRPSTACRPPASATASSGPSTTAAA